MANEFGDITLNGVQYRIELSGYQVTDLADFSPRAATPGGSVIHSELMLYQPLMMTDWRHGFGFHWYIDAMGYMRTEGKVDTRQAGLAMLYTDSIESDTVNDIKEGFANFNSKLWAWGGSYLRKYDSGSWSYAGSSGGSVSGTPTFALATGDYLFFTPNGLRIRKINTSEVDSNAGIGTGADDYKWLVIHNGYIYAGINNSNRIHYGSTVDLTDLDGDTTDANKIMVGGGSHPTIGAVSYAGNLYVSRADGLWVIGEDKIARMVLNYSNEASSDNFRSMVVHNGYLVFPIRDKIYQWNGSRVTDITPPKTTDTFPYVTYGRFDNFVAMGGYLYLTARTNETTYTESLLCFDGVGWFRLFDIITNGTGTVSALGYDTNNNRLWYHLDTTADKTYYISFQNQSDFPYAYFSTATSGSSSGNALVSSRLDMGFRRVVKSTPSILVSGSNLTANRYIRIFYSIDGAAFVQWGDVTSNGTTELTSPGGNDTIEYKHLIIKAGLYTNDTAQSPILEDITVRFLMRPDVFWGFSFPIIVADNYDYGGVQDNRSTYDIISTLQTLRDTKARVTFIDIYGISWKVYISAMPDRAIERHVDTPGAYPSIESIIQVNLVEVR